MRNQFVAIGLGSNLDKPIDNLRLALVHLKKSKFFKVLKVSSIYESDALLPSDHLNEWNKNFLNAVVLCEFSVDKTAVDLLNELKRIEQLMGRANAERWAPRIIDLDVLYWSLEPVRQETISIPHQELFKRPFALLPLLELWPDQNQIDKENLPIWSEQWFVPKPFNTKKSLNFFWPKLVGILNITDDSFSDGGRYLNSDELLKQCNKLIEQGADIIDIGAESTRPGARAVSSELEIKNLIWALKEIGHKIPISLDCRKANVIAAVLESCQVDYLNDVEGFPSEDMKNILLKTGLSAFVMHSLGVPPQQNFTLDVNLDPVGQLIEWCLQKHDELIEYGISSDKIIFDPGIGFGKTKEQSIYILNHLEKFFQTSFDFMIGHSRKSFLSLFSNRLAEERDLETALVTNHLNLAYVQYLRVHDIATQKLALSMRH